MFPIFAKSISDLMFSQMCSTVNGCPSKQARRRTGGRSEVKRCIVKRQAGELAKFVTICLCQFNACTFSTTSWSSEKHNQLLHRPIFFQLFMRSSLSSMLSHCNLELRRFDHSVSPSVPSRTNRRKNEQHITLKAMSYFSSSSFPHNDAASDSVGSLFW